MTELLTFEEIANNFSYLDSWEDRYHYLIELGHDLPKLVESDRTDANKVKECASKAWLVTHISQQGKKYTLKYDGESDSEITHGLIAIAISLYSGKTPAEILGIDALDAIRSIGLGEHVTPNRANGLTAIISRIQKEAHALSQIG